MHIPTGLVGECREHRSQHQNKKVAFHRLGQLILEWHREQDKKVTRKSGEVIRTYHAVENRVKDHLTGHTQTWDEVIDDMSEMIDMRARAVYQQEHDDHGISGSSSVSE